MNAGPETSGNGRMTRRRAFRCGAAGLTAVAGVGSIFSFFGRLKDEATPADVFRGDAPPAGVWEAWRARGWVKEASHYLKLDGNVQCKVCPNNCVLRPGDRSHCRN